MQGDDPPFLPVGTDVSAKYKGAFCEAKIKKVVRNIKCKVSLKAGGGTMTVNDDVIKGTLRVGSTVEVKQDPKKDAVEAIIAKIQDCSQYTVVFDDGDITTLRRSALCLKSGRHFNESETLDQLPLTHPEHFSTPVIAGRRGRRGRAQSDESEGEVPARRPKADSAEREPHVGRVVLVEAAGGAERRRPHQPAFPALVVAPTAQIKVKEDYLVRSFKDGRYYTVPKKEAREFRKGGAPLEWCGVDAALQYLNSGVLPPHWDRDSLFNEPRNTSDDSSDDEPREEKDHFVAQLYKFMDDRGTPLNRNPTIANRDIDLYRLFRVVQKLGGYNRVTNQNQWKTIADKMGFHPVTTSITNLCKQAYKKFLHSFEDFYRKLGVTLVAHPRGARTPPAGRSLIRDRDKQLLTSSSASSTPTGTPNLRKDKDSDKSETEKSDKSEKDEKIDKPKEKSRASEEDDSNDNVPLAVTTPKLEKEKEKEKEKAPEKEKEKEKEKPSTSTASTSIASTSAAPTTTTTTSEEKIMAPRSRSKSRSVHRSAPAEPDEKRLPKRRPMSTKRESPSTSASRRPHVSTDSDSSGRASRSSSSRCGLTKKLVSRRSQSANSASSGNTIASGTSKRPRKRKTTEPSTSEPTRRSSNVKAQVGDKLKVYYGPTQSESKVTYEAKVIEISHAGLLRVHYTGWNTRYDEWIKPTRIALNVTQHEQRNKKNTSISRRVRAKRTEESSTRSDSDSDSDSDVNVKRPPKKSEDKSISKTPSRSKDAAKSSDSSSSSKPRKRPLRTVSTPNHASPPKKPRPTPTTNPPHPPHAPPHPHPSHAGRDYDLNEIRSELKGLHTVKQEPEETVKQEAPEKEQKSPQPVPVAIPLPEPPQPEKQPEDVYEFKEPEPFELELHDEKKKRTHRIFDDISPSKYASTLTKSLSEEISEDPLRPKPTRRSPSLSPFRDFGTARDITVRESPDLELKDDPFSMDDDSFQDGSSGLTFEGFTPAKNQETYSKKSKVSKLRELIDDSPESPADDEQSSDDEPDEDIIMKLDSLTLPEAPESSSDEPPISKSPIEEKEEEKMIIDPPSLEDIPLPATSEPSEVPKDIDLASIPEPPKSPPPKKIESPPKKIEQPPKKIEPPPKKVEPPPKKVEPTPKKLDPPLKKVEPTPKKLEPPPKKVEQLPKKIELPPKKVEQPQKKVEQTAKKAESPLKKIDTPFKKIEQSPKKMELTPKKMELTPKKIEMTPKKIELTPKKIELPFKKMEQPLKKLELSIKKVEQPIKKVEQALNKVELTIKKVEQPLKKIELPFKKMEPKKLEIKKTEVPSFPSTSIIINMAAIPLPEPKPEAKEVKEDKQEPSKERDDKEEEIKLLSIPLPTTEPKEPQKVLPDVKPDITKLEPPSSPQIDTEEDKSEPDSPARLDVLPEPPPRFLLQSEGPKIAEKLLNAINSAKRLSMSPPPLENRPNTPKKDLLKIPKPEGKTSPVVPDRKSASPAGKPDMLKPLSKIEIVKKSSPIDAGISIFGEPSKLTDAKRDIADVKKVPTKPKDPTPPRLQSPLNILERRKSVAELPALTNPGKSNKVLSDTIQKLSSQINQAAAAAHIPLPPFPTADRSESSDSDEEDRRLIIDKLSVEEWASPIAEPLRAGAASASSSARALHAGKSAGEWSAGETLLMLEDACKNERKHSASVVVAGSGRVGSSGQAAAGGDDDTNISLLLCSETIPGSPAPESEPAQPRQRLHMPFASAPPHHHHKGSPAPESEPAQPRQRLHLPFASAPPHHHHKAEERAGGGSREQPQGNADEPAEQPRDEGGAAGAEAGRWARRHALLDNTPPTTPDSSLDMSPQPHRERRISERDSPSERKEDEDDGRNNDQAMDIEKPHGVRSRKASECSGLGGGGRGRRRARRDTDDHAHNNSNHAPPPLKYNFYVDLDPSWDCPTRITVLQTRLADLRKAYHSVKGELAAIDRRRKKLRRKEREAVKAAKAACS